MRRKSPSPAPPVAEPVVDQPGLVPVPPREALAEHEGPHCEHCDYDLTGLTRGFCPECGKPFTLGQVSQPVSREELPATPWDTVGGVLGFVETWVLAALSPGRMAKEFPARHSASSALAYSLICFAAAAAGLLVLVLIGIPAARADSMSLTIALAACLGFLTGLRFAQSAVAKLLARRSSPLYAPWPDHLWRGLEFYISGFAPLVAIAGGLLAIILLRDPPPGSSTSDWYILIAGVILAVVLIWWWAITYSMFKARAPRKRDRIMADLLIPVAFLRGMLVGAFLGVVAFLPLHGIVELVRFLLSGRS